MGAIGARDGPMRQLNSKASAEDRRLCELLAASAGGSREAFGELYDHLYTPIVRFTYRYTPDTTLIEEILNDTMLVVWQRADSFRGESRVMTWVLGIASRRALKTLQRERPWDGTDDVGVDRRPTRGETERLATLQALDWALGQLGVEQRLVIELAYFQGMTCEEMAEILDCPINTAKTRLYYGRRKLRAIFADADQPLEFNDFIDESAL